MKTYLIGLNISSFSWWIICLIWRMWSHGTFLFLQVSHFALEWLDLNLGRLLHSYSALRTALFLAFGLILQKEEVMQHKKSSSLEYFIWGFQGSRIFKNQVTNQFMILKLNLWNFIKANLSFPFNCFPDCLMSFQMKKL